MWLLKELSLRYFSAPHTPKDTLYERYTALAEIWSHELLIMWCLDDIKHQSRSEASGDMEQYIRTFLYRVLHSLYIDESKKRKKNLFALFCDSIANRKASLYVNDHGFMWNIEIWIQEACEAFAKVYVLYITLYTKFHNRYPAGDEVVLCTKSLMLELASINGWLFGQLNRCLHDLDTRHAHMYFNLDSNWVMWYREVFLDLLCNKVSLAKSYVHKNTSTTWCPFLKAKWFATQIFRLLEQAL